MCGSKGGGQGVRTSLLLKNYKNIGFHCNTVSDPMKNYKATKPAFNVGLSSARQRNAILIAFRWWADDGTMKAVFESSINWKKNVIKFGPPLKKLSGSAH